MKNKAIVLLSLSVCYLLYSAWVYTAGTEGPSITIHPDEAAQRGKLVYQKYNCTACHQLFGLGGYLGPELTTTMSQQGKGEILANAFLISGSPRMPNLHLQQQEVADVIEYLKYVDQIALAGKYSGSPIAVR